MVMGMLLLDCAVIVVLARLLGLVARRLGQPEVIGEIIGGILLGPTLFGGAIPHALFPAGVLSPLSTLANIGVVIFMFFVGMETDSDMMRGQGRIATSVAVSATAVPFALGVLLALGLAGHHPTPHRLAFVLFLGTAMAITAFPVLARILTDRNLLRTPIGGLALTSAAIGDVLAWSLLAVAAALAGAGRHPWLVLFVVPYAAAMLFVVRPLLGWLLRRAADSESARPVVRGLVGAGVVAVLGSGLWASAEATDRMGLHLIFGAYLFGVAMPAGRTAAVVETVLPWARRIGSLVLLPIFFMVAGVKVNLSTVDGSGLGELGLILLVAVGSKFLGAFAAARLNGVRVRHSAVIAILINTRGLTELIVLTVGLQLRVLDSRLYSLMVVMALVTTTMTGVLLRIVYPAHRMARDSREPVLAAEQTAIPVADRSIRRGS
jgi:Kef-type K+ transport system membrane component KefB